MNDRKAQAAIEYMILLGVVVSVVLVSFTTLLPRTTNMAGNYFETVQNGLYGNVATVRTTSNDYP